MVSACRCWHLTQITCWLKKDKSVSKSILCCFHSLILLLYDWPVPVLTHIIFICQCGAESGARSFSQWLCIFGGALRGAGPSCVNLLNAGCFVWCRVLLTEINSSQQCCPSGHVVPSAVDKCWLTVYNAIKTDLKQQAVEKHYLWHIWLSILMLNNANSHTSVTVGTEVI